MERLGLRVGRLYLIVKFMYVKVMYEYISQIQKR